MSSMSPTIEHSNLFTAFNFVFCLSFIVFSSLCQLSVVSLCCMTLGQCRACPCFATFVMCEQYCKFLTAFNFRVIVRVFIFVLFFMLLHCCNLVLFDSLEFTLRTPWASQCGQN